jgi:catechol 2,3-dioxygenase-like lactoylglutathione lyase family enzyme
MADPVRFHLSLNVAHLDRSVEFFRTLFGTEPAKLRADYAKFEPDTPPLVLSLEPARAVVPGGALNHVGLRLPDVPSLVAMQERLERSGVRTQREDGVECCYARQTKFWLHDPDGNLWEVYTLDGDIEHRGAGQAEEVVQGKEAGRELAGTACGPATIAWEHRMGSQLPEKIQLADGAAVEVSLRGTLNASHDAAVLRGFLSEVHRVLAPGGRLFVHVLAGERRLAMPGLGGAAAAVECVPEESEPLVLLEAAGFEGMKLLKYDAKPCFVRDGVAMREMQLEAFSPLASSDGTVEVMYKGPLREVSDDGGRTYPRGRRVVIPATAAARLRNSLMADQFTHFGPAGNRSATEVSCGS